MSKRYNGGFLSAVWTPLAVHGDLNELYTWGQNVSFTTDGMLGDNTTETRSSPVQIGTLNTWALICGGSYHSSAIKTDGTMWMWGGNDYGQLGQDDRTKRSSPVQVGTLTGWSKIATKRHTLAIKTNGTLWGWARNDEGGLGDGTRIRRSSPVQIGALTTWSKIDCGSDTSLALKTDGSMWTWGSNSVGQLAQNNKIYRSSPVQIGATPAAETTNWSLAAGGEYHTMAIKTDGTMWTWGSNVNGSIGDNTVILRSSPVQIGTLTTWSKIAASSGTNSMALKTDGTMWMWGRNGQGQIGDNTVVYRSSPVQVGALTTWSSIAASSTGSMAIKTNGTMWLWGDNAYGSTGDNTTLKRSSPVQIGADTNWSSIAVSNDSHSMAIKTNGTMWLWGKAEYGRIGDNTSINRSSPVQIGADTNWSQIAAGSRQSMAIKTTGTMWLWGCNIYGQIGDNTVIHRSSPVQVGSLTTWSKIAGAYGHSLALKTDGTLWSFGYNGHGQIGDSTLVRRSSPVQVGALATWSTIAAGRTHSLAIETDGTWYSWGRNQAGQVGDNTVVLRSSPVQIGAFVYSWTKISGSGGIGQFAIRADGTLWAWGTNTGDNTGEIRSSPVQIGADTNWSLISSSSYHALAVRADGTMWSWGNPGTGPGVLGDNTSNIIKSSPIQIGALTSWSLVSAGAYHNLAVKKDGTLWAWGKSANHGRLGDNTTISRSSPVQIGALTTWGQISVGRNHSMAFEATPF